MSCVAMALPRLGWPTFFEEPAMLMGVVLLGKTLEERAKLAASSDMASLQVGSRAAHLLVSIMVSFNQCPSKVQTTYIYVNSFDKTVYQFLFFIYIFSCALPVTVLYPR
jgi:cation transport ATPase